MEKCLADIQSWMIDERLLINDDKTEVLYLTLRGILMLKVFFQPSFFLASCHWWGRGVGVREATGAAPS